MTTVVVDAPVEQGLPVKLAADAYAATAKAGGDKRRIGVLRAEGLGRICSDYLAGSSTTSPRRARVAGRSRSASSSASTPPSAGATSPARSPGTASSPARSSPR
jgi:hypothetical protein